ncbi:MAG: 30S ribosomal protein S18 [Candidatus Omnitrophota bacterium]
MKRRMDKKDKPKKRFKKFDSKSDFFKKKSCRFCAEKIDSVDYKDILKLRKFVSEKGKMLPNRVTGNCARHQRAVAMAVKRARYMALLPYVGE